MSQEGSGAADALTSLFRHHKWANLKLLDFCAGLSDEQLGATAAGTYGSIRGTLAHMIFAEVDYVERMTGRLLVPYPSEDRFPGFEMLKDAARQTGDEMLRIALGAEADAIVHETGPSETDPQVTIFIEYPLSSFLAQVINHATEHRTQVSAIITQLGVEPPDMAGWAYMGEAGEFREGVEAQG